MGLFSFLPFGQNQGFIFLFAAAFCVFQELMTASLGRVFDLVSFAKNLSLGHGAGGNGIGDALSFFTQKILFNIIV